jgi:ribosome-associated translation inhibitor RaiA
MNCLLELEFHNTRPIGALETRIRQELAELEKFYDHIAKCRVDVELPHDRRKGSLSEVRVELRVPVEDAATPPAIRGAVVVDGDKECIHVTAHHKDPILAAHEAFTTLRQRVETFTAVRTQSPH